MPVFLAPVALAGLALLAVPILIHLFKPRRVRVIPFSSLRWLRTSRHKFSRRLQWHQALLFVLRATLLAALALAMAKPFFSRSGHGKIADRVIILDRGRTMGYQPADRPTPVALAGATAAQLLRQTPAHANASLIALDADAAFLIPPTQDPVAQLARLGEVRAGAPETDIGAALRLLPAVLNTHSQRDVAELAFITDLASAAWSQGSVARFQQAFSRPLKISIFDVGHARAQNAWIAGAELSAPDASGRRTITVSMGATGEQTHERRLRVSGIPGMPDATRAVALDAARQTTTIFELPSGAALDGVVAQFSLEPRDALESDDFFWLPLDAKAGLQILLIEPSSTQIAELQPAHHLRVALESLAAAMGGSLELASKSPEQTQPSDIIAADAIILVDTKALPEDVVESICSRVQDGAGLAVFLGPDIDAGFLNNRLCPAKLPESRMLPAEILERVNLSAGLAHFSDIRWDHPLLRALSDPAYGDLSGVGIKSFYRLEVPDADQDVSVLARINGENPAIVAKTFGAGKTLLFNITANDAWSDLPRRKSFVPLLDGLIAHLTGGWRRRVFTAGEAVVLPLPIGADVVKVTAPSGREVPAMLRSTAGKTIAHIEAATEPGVYMATFRGAGERSTMPFVVQAARRASAMSRIAEGTLKQWWAPAEVEIITPEPSADINVRLPWSRSLEPWLLALAFLAFLAEIILAHRLCPKAPPPITHKSGIAENGFFEPTPASEGNES